MSLWPVGRKARFYLKPLPTHRVGKGASEMMQRNGTRMKRPLRAILCVANDGVMAGSKLRSNLMVAAGLELDLDERCGTRADSGITQHAALCAFRPFPSNNGAMVAMRKPVLERARSLFHLPLDDRKVALLHLSRPKDPAETSSCLCRFGKADDPGDSSVKSVDGVKKDIPRFLIAHFQARLPALLQRLGMMDRSLSAQASGLVHDEQVIIFKEEFICHRFAA